MTISRNNSIIYFLRHTLLHHTRHDYRVSDIHILMGYFLHTCLTSEVLVQVKT